MSFRVCHLWIEGSLFFVFESSLARAPECSDLQAFLERLAGRVTPTADPGSYYPHTITAEERGALEELLASIPADSLKRVGMLDVARKWLALASPSADIAVTFS